MADESRFADEVPDTPVGRQMLWLLDNIVTKGENLTEKEVESRLAREARRQIPAKLLILGFADIHRILGDFEFEGLDEEESPTPLKAVAILGNVAGDKFRLPMEVEYEEPNPIKGAAILPAPDLRAEPAASSFEEFEEAFKGLAQKASFFAAEVVKGELVPMYSFGEDESLAVGQAARIYILGELARQVEENPDLKWLKEIPVKDGVKGAATSPLYDKEEGTTYSIRHFAEEMMKGDGLASDHLLDLLGRDNVEKAQEMLGHSNPSVNTPFLSNRDLTVLKASSPAKQVEAYVAAEPAKRREMLESKVRASKPPTIEKLAKWETARFIEDIGWYASSLDLARAMLGLKGIKDRKGMQPLGTALSKNPGLPFDKYAWLYTGFAGGGEPGVLSMSWLLGRVADDRWFVMTGTLNDPGRIEGVAASPLFMAASDLLAFHRKKSGKRGRFGLKKG